MEADGERKRHLIVTVWLWLSILANAVVVCLVALGYFLGGVGDFGLGRLELLFSIAVITGNALLLNWKIIGFFIGAAAVAFSSFFMAADTMTRTAPVILVGALTILIYFGFLCIRKNGVSVWRRLINEAKARKRRTVICFAAVFGSALIVILATIFPAKSMYGNVIVMFAPERMVRLEHYRGRVLGRHVLITEHGEIRIEPFAEAILDRGQFWIPRESFESGLASHSLVVEGIRMPENLCVWIWPWPWFWRGQSEVSSMRTGENFLVYGIPVVPDPWRAIMMDYYSATVNLWLPISFADEYIALADSTQIYVRIFVGDLAVYRGCGHWALRTRGRFSSLWVKRPGEDDFVKYEAIKFGQNWGDFIEGRLPE